MNEIDAIFILSNYFKRYLNDKAKTIGLSDAQCRFLYIICKNEKKGVQVTQKLLENCYNNQKSSVSELLKTMENNGLIERITCDKDSRIKYVKCTDKGKTVYDIAKKNYICLLNKLIDGIDKEDLNAFKKIISKMIENMEEIYD